MDKKKGSGKIIAIVVVVFSLIFGGCLAWGFTTKKPAKAENEKVASADETSDKEDKEDEEDSDEDTDEESDEDGSNNLLNFLDGLFTGEYSDVAQEDDVVIADIYVIESTTAISDAYISGDDSALSDEEKETLQMASDVLDEIITDDMDNYEKEKAVYTWIRDNIKHDESVMDAIRGASDADDPHGVLENKQAVCVGYATTFRLLTQMLGFDCKVCHSSDRIHSWDLIKMDDGNWYHCDVYSDAETNSYSNFNQTDDIRLTGWDWNTDFFPEANGTEYCYILKDAIAFTSFDDVAQRMHDLIANGEEGFFTITFTDDQWNDETYEILEYLGSYADQYVYSTEDYTDEYAEWSTMPTEEGGYFYYNLHVYTWEEEEYEEGEEEEYVKSSEEVLANEIINRIFADKATAW